MVLFDRMLEGTPFRGLVIQGFTGLCGYIGVPDSHYLSDMDSLDFDCHGEITFRGPGDGDIRPQGWYWYGWDYQHPGDQRKFPDGHFEGMPPEFRHMLERENSDGKSWSVLEVEHELIDSAVALMGVISAAREAANDTLRAAMHAGQCGPKT